MAPAAENVDDVSNATPAAATEAASQPEAGDPPGLIYPPPEIRKIVDKTAIFVARNGIQFEERIREKEKNDPKFCFLNPNDPYHAYYAFKLSEQREGKGMLLIFRSLIDDMRCLLPI
jgi:splicing factor 3A subunit 1